MRVIACTTVFAAATQANPIRKVVSLLQNMQTKIEAEAERDDALFAKFECYCNTNSEKTSAAITAGKAKVQQLETDIPEAQAQRSQVVSELAQHKQDRTAANEAVEEATAQRKKENDAFEAEEADLKQNKAAMDSAIAAIEKGMTGFLQTAAGSRVVQAMKAADVGDEDVQSVQAFFQNKEGGNSGEIVGILKELRDSMSKRLEEITSTEQEAVANYNELRAAKNRELSAAQEAIEEKTQRQGELAVKVAELKNDLDETSTTLEKDEDYSVQLKRNCDSKAKEYEGIKKTRSEELLALADTIKVLNSDDALELFKKALPSSESLLQLQTTDMEVRSEALELVQGVARKFHHTKLDLIAMAIRGKKKGFADVVKLIDEMIAALKVEQTDDDAKVAYCEKEIDATEDKQKQLKHEMDGVEAHIAADENDVDTLQMELKELAASIKSLDKSVAEATEQRKTEHEEYIQNSAEDNAALELIEFAKNRLNKFYNPKQHKEPEAEEAESFIQLTDAPPAFGSSSGGAASGGVIGMLDKIRDDLKTSMNEESLEEKDSQEEYEQLMADSSATRATYVAARTEKEAALADANADLTDAKSQRAETAGDISETKEAMRNLHGTCDFVQSNYDARKSARNEEIEALDKAKSVLSGASVSLIQTKTFLSRK
mmetsp:Transcript_38148/g.91634  ORF Transcript_38148/g.91634 Transcript_38148/m.91634 type:complete len:660 (+) Transcript_38148:97-2076(+)